ncbi:MAG: 50S ribosomal protein L18e [Candidatus Methanofastidiosa archaeon]|nr:50S ribosomal protein L18e [Candidatus Methanofastidiosa archaeon]
MKKIKKTNPNLVSLIEGMRSKGYNDEVALWVALSKRLSKPTRHQSEVNISKINRFTKDGDTIVVPGKVLGSGELDHKVTVAAYKFSQVAKDKIAKSGETLTIPELMERNPKGSKVRIFGG